MSPTETRIQLLAAASKHPPFEQLIGCLSEENLSAWLSAELGRPTALDTFSEHGNIRSKAIAPEYILHIVSQNTPHAALQSLLRGLLLGAHNIVKLPSGGLPDLVTWIESLPELLSQKITLSNDIQTIEWTTADVVVAIGSDSTIESIQQGIEAHQTFIPHGHKISMGIVTDSTEEAAVLAAKDVSMFDQCGCLSLHAIYVDESAGASAKDFSKLLAQAMADYCKENPPEALSLSEAGAVHNFRETTRFLAANNPATELIESQGSLDWTVVYREDPTLQLSCLGRCVSVSPLPDPLDTDTLGPEAKHLSTIALYPFESAQAEALTQLPAHRVCRLGESQQPSLFWHHDGFAPLASLVSWKDIG